MNILSRYKLARDPAITVANLVHELLRRAGDCETSVDEHGAHSLAELDASLRNKDAFLRRVVGLAPRQTVAIFRTNDRQCFHWFLAIIRAGGIAVPLNPMLSLPEVRRILTESGTETLITDRATFERTIGDRSNLPARKWIQADGESVSMDGFLRPVDSGEPFLPAVIDPTATIAVFHTSGTSGFPKGAALSSNALLGARSSTVLARLFLGPRDLALVALPWSHIMAVSVALYGILAGIRGSFLDRFEVDIALDRIEKLRVTTVVGVPAMFARLVNSKPDPARLRTARVWLSASDHLPQEIREQLRQLGGLVRLPGGLRIPPVILNGYGMVELGGLAMMGIDLSFLPGSGDMCIPLPPFRVRVADENGTRVKAGVTGECQIRRHGTRPHYWNDKNDGENLLTDDGWLRTGDFATCNRLGLIRLAGRMKDVIKSGGYSVYVRELEEVLLAHPSVARAAAFGVPHSEKGEIPVAAVELHEDLPASENDLLTWCRQNLALYKAPRRIWILEPCGLPQNHNGKIVRRMLRERFQDEAVPHSPA